MPGTPGLELDWALEAQGSCKPTLWGTLALSLLASSGFSGLQPALDSMQIPKTDSWARSQARGRTHGGGETQASPSSLIHLHELWLSSYLLAEAEAFPSPPPYLGGSCASPSSPGDVEAPSLGVDPRISVLS